MLERLNIDIHRPTSVGRGRRSAQSTINGRGYDGKRCSSDNKQFRRDFAMEEVADPVQRSQTGPYRLCPTVANYKFVIGVSVVFKGQGTYLAFNTRR